MLLFFFFFFFLTQGLIFSREKINCFILLVGKPEILSEAKEERKKKDKNVAEKKYGNRGGTQLCNFELGTDVRPENSITTL